MSAIAAFFDLIGTWFGYVGGCVATPNLTCVPFAAFLGLAGAAGAALALVLLAWRAGQQRAVSQATERAVRIDPTRSRSHARARSAPRVAAADQVQPPRRHATA